MSRTNRKIVREIKKDNPYSKYDNWRGGEEVIVDETRAKHQQRWCKKNRKLKPYSKRGEFKYKYSHAEPESKLVIRNANRSLKKGVRQNYKKEIQRELEVLNYGE